MTDHHDLAAAAQQGPQRFVPLGCPGQRADRRHDRECDDEVGGGAPLDHDHTVRAITSRIDLGSLTADVAADRID
ncbi:MAG: hypothetical protein ACRELS_04050, partial [Candidatus Rokuibacteriota bacterium]